MLGSLRLHEITADVASLNVRLHADIARASSASATP